MEFQCVSCGTPQSQLQENLVILNCDCKYCFNCISRISVNQELKCIHSQKHQIDQNSLVNKQLIVTQLDDNCQLHFKKNEFFCMDHKKKICKMCFYQEHNGHQISIIRDLLVNQQINYDYALKTYQQNLQNQVSQVLEEKKQSMQILHLTEKMQRKCISQIENDLIKIIKEECNKLVEGKVEGNQKRFQEDLQETVTQQQRMEQVQQEQKKFSQDINLNYELIVNIERLNQNITQNQIQIKEEIKLNKEEEVNLVKKQISQNTRKQLDNYFQCDSSDYEVSFFKTLESYNVQILKQQLNQESFKFRNLIQIKKINVTTVELTSKTKKSEEINMDEVTKSGYFVQINSESTIFTGGDNYQDSIGLISNQEFILYQGLQNKRNTTKMTFDQSHQLAYIIAGQKAKKKLADAEVFNFYKKKSTKIESFKQESCFFGICQQNDLVFTFGGKAQGSEQQVSFYNPHNNK